MIKESYRISTILKILNTLLYVLIPKPLNLLKFILISLFVSFVFFILHSLFFMLILRLSLCWYYISPFCLLFDEFGILKLERERV